MSLLLGPNKEKGEGIRKRGSKDQAGLFFLKKIYFKSLESRKG